MPYCLPFSEENLFKSLSNKECSPVEVAAQMRPRFLMNYLTEIEARTIVVEDDYIDKDYLIDYVEYYARCFRDYPKRCRRVHFFAADISDADFQQLIATPKFDDFASTYLGFIVARPLPDAIIGRTALKPYPENGRRHYTAVRDYIANLCGHELRVRSLAFQEQDTVLAACATVALWSSYQKLSDLYNTPAPTPSIITSAATEYVSSHRRFPSHGLDVQQMSNAIKDVGLEPEVFRLTEGTPLCSLIYSYLACGNPVLLGVEVEGVGLHAIAVCGYSIGDKPHLSQEIGPKAKPAPPLSGLRIQKFYAHDDQIGPFSSLIIEPHKTVPVITGGTKTHPVTFTGNWWKDDAQQPRRLYPYVAIVPVYHKIRITFMDFLKWVRRVNKVIERIPRIRDLSRLEWDVQLTTTNDYKKQIIQSMSKKPFASDILSGSLPKFFWRASLRLENQLVFEMLADATDMVRSFPIFKILWHDPLLEDYLKKALVNEKFKDEARETLRPRLYEFIVGS